MKMSTNNTSGLNVSVVPPVVDWHEHDHQSHVVQFYEADNSLLDDVSRFIGTALGAGDSAIVIATEPHRLEIHRRLGARGFDPAKPMCTDIPGRPMQLSCYCKIPTK